MFKKLHKDLQPVNPEQENADERKLLHSMNFELSLMITSVIIAALVIIGIISSLFLESFYKNAKIRRMQSAYSKLEYMTQSDIDASEEIREILNRDSIQITVVSSTLDSVSTTGHEPSKNLMRLYRYVTGISLDNRKILKVTSHYVLQMTMETHPDATYIEMWGQLVCGDYFLLQTSLDSIKAAADLTLLFYICVGACVILVSLLLVHFLVRRYTKPLLQLNAQAKRMANLDFEARYEGDEQNEIGDLGKSFNKMSDELEKTVSELKSANTELLKDNEQKTQIDEVRKEFLNNVSHELKTPIALIQGYAEGLRDNIAEDPESRSFYCDVIIDESAKMNTMVRKLLTLNQLEFGNDPVIMDRFDLTGLIRGVINGMQIMIEEAGATVVYAPEGTIYAWGDEFKIEEVVTNYLSNAVHHCKGSKKIEVTVRREGNIVTTTVFNTGDPIPEPDVNRVFEKFYKVDKARTREYGGSGIGLSIVRAIVESHHQKCGVQNYENGVAFWFTLEGK
ncbi:MAG: HAMP domain-containing sensor histidine kinase [Lachnospiraceae bacterium]|nr:HAMP domain-containing sensor histidine kinase [Lachnospiraceae bacterium]